MHRRERSTKERWISDPVSNAWLICNNFRISVESEAILDLGDLLMVELKNDNTLASDTKWDEVISSMNTKPVDTILKMLYRMQLEKSDELKFIMQMHEPETIFQGKPHEYERRKQCVPKDVEQKTRDSLF